jgi:tripartite-type tricarboxylate transporter receptor subunit TctC
MKTLLQNPGARVACLAAAFTASGLCAAATAVELYPNKPIRIIVPSAPSSGPDVVTRLLGIRLTEAWGQHIVADARPGAAGNIGSEIAARALPDGYTLLMASSQQISGPLFFDKLSYNLIKDFVPISLIASTPYVLNVHPSVAAGSVKELIALAKAKPGALHYGSSGVGGAPHIAAEMFKTMTGVNLVHVPYRSVVFALVDVMAGQIQMAFSVMPAALPHIRQGKLRALGVTGLKRAPLAPELETIAETVPGYETIGWYGLVAPNGTPNRIITTLSAEVVKALKTPDIQEKLVAMGAEPIGTPPQEFAAFMTAQNEKLRKTMQAAGLRPK